MWLHVIKKHVWKLEQRYKLEFAIMNKLPLLWYRFRWLDIGNVLENKNSKWSFYARFTGAGYIWAMENHFDWYFPKLWKGTFVFISPSIQKGKSICVQEEGGKERIVPFAPLGCLHCAECMRYEMSSHESSKLLSGLAASTSSPLTHPTLASFHHHPLK